MIGQTWRRGQIALEFIMIYSAVLIAFLVIFAIVINQRATTLTQQEYGSLQLVAQNVASYIDQALSSGNGYSATLVLPPSTQLLPYNISISSTGVVIVNTTIGKQDITAEAYSVARNLVINGANSTLSANGITIYSVPISSGEIQLSNAKGIIFIDQNPVSTLGLAKYIFTKLAANVNAAAFDGKDSAVSISGVNLASNSTVGMWIYPGVSQMESNSYIMAKGPGQPFIEFEGSNTILAGAKSADTIPVPIKTGTWTYIAASYIGSSNSIYLYVNGNQITSTVSPFSIASNANQLELGSAEPLNLTGGWFNGSISNVQIYNSTLSANVVYATYTDGIGGAPLNANTLTGWWPLNGDAIDYSGNGNEGTAYNITYDNVVQLTANVKGEDGADLNQSLIGTVASNGSIYQNSNSNVTYTNVTGNNTIFITGNSPGIQRITIDAYNDNASTVRNLMGWWPLSVGYGNTIYDLSGHRNNALFSGYIWNASSMNATAMSIASFNGNSVIIGNTPAMSTSNITISAWINGTGIGTYPQNIAEAFGPFAYNEIFGIGVESDNGNALVSWDNRANTVEGGPITSNTLYMITGVWDGNNNTLGVYVDGVLLGSGRGDSATLATVTGFNIGGGYGSVGGFNGTVSNVQAYNNALSGAQIRSLYGSGLDGTPLANAGLAGWWPLDGKVKDYANLNYVNNSTSGVTFNQIRYVGQPQSGSLSVATFNGVNHAETVSGYNAPRALTISLWLYPSNFTNNYQFPLNSSPSGLWRLGFSPSNQIYIDPGTGSNVILNSFVKFNVWQNIAISASDYANAVNYTAYLNGVEINRSSVGGNIQAVNNLIFGAGTFTGQIADIQVYNTSLSKTQLQQIYLQGLPLIEKFNLSHG